MSMSLKLSLNNKVRRVQIADKMNLSYQELIDTTKKLFPKMNKNKKISFSYVDDENECVVLSSQDELKEAMRVLETMKLLNKDPKAQTSIIRFEVIKKISKFDNLDDDSDIEEGEEERGVNPGERKTCNLPPSLNNQVEHKGITCDECGMSPVIGNRYKCSIRDDFDLCELCETSQIQPFPMIKIYNPEQSPDVIIAFKDDGNNQHHYGRRRGGYGGFGLRRMFQDNFSMGLGGQRNTNNNQQNCNNFNYQNSSSRCPQKNLNWKENKRCNRDNNKNDTEAQIHIKAPIIAAIDEKMKAQNDKNIIKDKNDFDEQDEINFHNDAQLAEAVRISSIESKNKVNIVQGEISRSNNSNNTNVIGRIISNVSTPVIPEIQVSKSLPTNVVPVSVAPQSVASTVPVPVTISSKPAARFVRDVTCPDGSCISANSVFNKTWKIRNDGNDRWPTGCGINFVGGDALCDPKLDIVIPAIDAGMEVDLTLQLTAPAQTGRHVSYFKLKTPEGNHFGQRLWADIRVIDDEASSWHCVSGVLQTDESNVKLDSNDSVLSRTITEDDDKILSNEVSNKDDKGNVTLSPSILGEKVETDDFENIVNEITTSDATSINNGITSGNTLIAPSVWERELTLLREMGFSDSSNIIPLLSEHCITPVSLGLPGDHPNADGLQRVIAHLLTQSGINLF